LPSSRHGGQEAAVGEPAAALRGRGTIWKSLSTPDWRVLLLSIAVQLALGLFLGHSRDMRLFMSAGYLVGTGHSPYVARDLTAVFHHISFKAVSTVGYPPPWPLLAGVIYRGTYAIGHDLLVYNLALKLPVIAANIGLAYLVAAVLKSLGTGPQVARRAWVLLLLNPFVLYVGAAWGEIDAIVALLTVSALWLLYTQRNDASAIVLALAVCFKPTALPLLPVALVFLATRSPRSALRYAAVLGAGAFAFYVLPFLVLGWDATPVRQLNSHFIMSGTMSFMTVVRLFRDPLLMQGHWWLLGLAWIPALAVAILALRHGIGDFGDLVAKSVALVLVFFLTRTWLAETNLVLVLPLTLILVSLDRLDRRAFTALWVLPLVFTVFNASPLRLLWVAYPEAMERTLTYAGRYGDMTLLARAALVVAWQVVGWWIVVTCLRRRPATAGERRAAAAGTLQEGAPSEAAPQEGAPQGGAPQGAAPWR
jgi:hypothetical protein